MALTAGTRLGPYEVVSAIGAGGMGEVYRAHDTKLNRDVALKILPASFATDADRLARFRREAYVLASLNHANIGHIYGFEDSGAVHALVLEFVDGPTLADRIASGPIPLADALPIARQIADALETAHEHGIVHRDLKPANIKLKGASGPTPTRREDGRHDPALSAADVAGCTVKVLDFGLAKALTPDAAGASSEAMNSPTLTVRGTELGLILGTAGYMAPEQARGKAVDKRADIWAFGVIVYEMLTGRRAFAGEEISDVLAAVLRQEIDWQALPPETPPQLRRLLERCLDRDGKTRLRDIGEARVELTRIEAGVEDFIRHPARTADVPATPARWRQMAPWALAGTLGAGLVAVLLLWAPWQPAMRPTPVRLSANVGADAVLQGVSTGIDAMALSPDGLMLAFAGQQGGTARLFIRKLDQLQAAPLAGTEDAANPFFSPNGQWVAFFAGGKLKKVSVSGGATVTLADAPNPRGGTWTEDGTIIFTPNTMSSNVASSRLMKIPDAGGTPEVVIALSEGAATQRWPQALPGGKGILYTEHSTSGGFDAGNVVVAPMSGGTPKVVVRGAYHGRYVSSGHLIYMAQGSLFAVRFDLDRLEAAGAGVPVLEGVSAITGTGGAQFAVSTSGTLVYVPGVATGSEEQIDWLEANGKTSVLQTTKTNWTGPRFSPDGSKLATDVSDGKAGREIAVFDIARDTLTQLTFDPSDDIVAVWTPDGRRITFSSDRGKTGVHNIYWQNADGSGNPQRLTDSPQSQRAWDWHPSGKYLAFVERGNAGSWDLKILPMEGSEAQGWKPGKPVDFLSTPAQEVGPAFSPDGQWIASASNENGPYEVYVRPFPGPGGKWRISTEGGIFPRWSRTQPELLFLSQNKVFSASYSVTGTSFRVDRPRLWSPTAYLPRGSSAPYDVHPDGKRVALLTSRDQAGSLHNHVVFIFNFTDYLTKIVPATK